MTNKSFFDAIQKHYDSNLPFVVFKKPNTEKISAYLQPNNVINSETGFEKSGFVYSPFVENTSKTIWFYDSECECISTLFNKEEQSISDLFLTSSENNKKDYLQLLENTITKLKKGDLQKVIISRIVEQPIEKIDFIKWFKKSCNLYPTAFSYCWFHPKIGMWFGASPETLVSYENSYFKTMALAGTLPKDNLTENDWGIKEKEEQQLVVDSILEALLPIATQVKNGETVTHKAGSLLHLKTKIEGELKSEYTIKALIEALHPTSALCGLPKQTSKNYILNNEGYNREYYTGFLGEFNSIVKTELYVNLRCMKIDDKMAKIYVGGGLTALSNAENEWQETVNKSQIMKRVLS